MRLTLSNPEGTATMTVELPERFLADLRGPLTFRAPLPKQLQDAEDATQAADFERTRGYGRIIRNATTTERELLKTVFSLNENDLLEAGRLRWDQNWRLAYMPGGVDNLGGQGLAADVLWHQVRQREFPQIQKLLENRGKNYE